MVSGERHNNVAKDWAGGSAVESAPVQRRMVQTSYQDDEGRWWAVLVPAGQEQDAHMGIPLGPPDLSPLELPLAVEVRLHNQLFSRGLFSLRDVRRAPRDIFAAIQAAYRADVAAVTGLYQ